MINKRWSGFRLELAATELGGTEGRPKNLVPRGAKIRGVVFEPCGVLYDDSAWRRWLWQLISRMGLSTQYTPFFRAWESEFQEAIWSGQLDLWTALSRFLRSAGMSRPDIDEVIAASRAKFRRFEQDTRPFPDVCWTLRQFHASDVRLAVVAHDQQSAAKIRERLDRVGIGSLVTHVFGQQQDTSRLNWAEWQRNSLTGLPDPPAHWAFVGRRQSSLDVAHRLGMLTVAINHDADTVADVYLEQFSQLGLLLHRQAELHSECLPAKAA